MLQSQHNAAVYTCHDMMLQSWLDAAATQIAGCRAGAATVQMQLNKTQSMKWQNMLCNLNALKCHAIIQLVIVARIWGQAIDQLECCSLCTLLTSAACIALSVFGIYKAKQQLRCNTRASWAQVAEHLLMERKE
jgi:ABC-type uncharacterized transport system permease subunit